MSDTGELRLVLNIAGQRARTRHDLEIGVFHLQRDGPPFRLCTLDPLPHDVRNIIHRLAQGRSAGNVVAECPFPAHGFADPVCADRAQIDPPRGAVEIIGETAEIGAHEFNVLRRKVRARFDAQPGHLLGAFRTNPVKPADRQSRHELRALTRLDDADSIGLILVAGQLGDEFVVADARAGGQSGLFAYPRPDQFGDPGRAADTANVVGHVEICLVQAERFHMRREIEEYLADFARCLAVGIEPAFYEDQIGAQPLCRDRWHRGTNPEFSRFIACRCNHAAAAAAPDGHGLALQVGIVALFHAGEERIHIDMDDLAQAAGFIAAAVRACIMSILIRHAVGIVAFGFAGNRLRPR